MKLTDMQWRQLWRARAVAREEYVSFEGLRGYDQPGDYWKKRTDNVARSVVAPNRNVSLQPAGL